MKGRERISSRGSLLVVVCTTSVMQTISQCSMNDDAWTAMCFVLLQEGVSHQKYGNCFSKLSLSETCCFRGFCIEEPFEEEKSLTDCFKRLILASLIEYL